MTNEELDRLIEALDQQTAGQTNKDLLNSMGINDQDFIDLYLLPKVEETAARINAKGLQHMLLPLIVGDLVMNGLIMGMAIQKIKDSEGTWTTARAEGSE